MDVNRLTQGEKIAGGSAILLFIVMFFSWFGLPDSALTNALGSAGFDTTANAWQAFDFIDIVLLITVVVAIAAAVATAADQRVDFPLSTVVTVLGALSTILVLYRIIDPPSDASRKFGVFLGLIFAAALTYGGWLAMQSEGTSFQDAADRLGGGGRGPGPGPGAGGGDPYAAPPRGDEPPSAPPPPPPPPPAGGNPPSV
jgi:hypothetical protein